MGMVVLELVVLEDGGLLGALVSQVMTLNQSTPFIHSFIKWREPCMIWDGYGSCFLPFLFYKLWYLC
jgi:hypothetical protein